MLRSAAFAVALLALAACDSGASDDALVGTWTFASVSSQQVATVSRSQTVVDMSLPPSGAIALSGAETGSLTFINGYYRYGTSSSLYLTSYDVTAPTYPDVRTTMVIQEDPGVYFLTLDTERQGTGGYEYRHYAAERQGRVRTGATFTPNADLASIDGTVRASGTLTLGNRQMVANQPTPLSGYTYEFEPGSAMIQYVFEGDGTLRMREIMGSRTTEHVGTWLRSGEQVTLSTTIDGTTTTIVYDVALAGSMLSLTGDTGDVCSADCRRSVEDQFGIDPGTLASLRSETVLRLSQTATPRAAARTASMGGSAVGLPAVLRDRLTLTPLSTH